jgi:hypothetical protein
MRRALLSTTALALSLLVAGAGAAAANTDDPSPIPSPSVSDAPATVLDESESPSTASSAEPELETTYVAAPTYTCDADPSDDFQLPADTEAVTYTLEGDNFVATLNEGYEWGEQPNPDPDYDVYESTPGFEFPFTGPTDPVVMPIADMAFPHCNHDDETQVAVSAECTDGMGYLVYDIDAPWAPADGKNVTLVGNTGDEVAHARSYRGIGLSGRLAWDGSSPGGEHPFEFGEVSSPFFTIVVETPEGTHKATEKVNRYRAEDPCLGVDPGDPGDPGDGGDNAAGGDDDELAATGPEAAWLTAGAAALLVAVGATLVVVRRRMSA